MITPRIRLTPRWLAVAAVAATVAASAADQQLPQEAAKRFFEAFEVKTQPKPPPWAAPDAEPLFSFTWLSDVHLSPGRVAFFTEALRYIDDELNPDLIVFTGDNNYVAAPADPDQPEPQSLRRQRFLRGLLDEHLKTPYAIIPGDNWPQGFEQAFGPFQYSFDCGGLHFLFAAADRADHRKEGLAVLDDPTWQWLRSDLEAHREQPVIFLMHEPAVPPTFLDAGRLQKLLDEYPNVLAGFHGHLHADLHVDTPARPYLVCPSFEPRLRGGFKHVLVYKHALILHTLGYDDAEQRFVFVNKWQKIDVPEPLRAKLHSPKPGGPIKQNYDALTAHPHREAPELGERQQELIGPALQFLSTHLPGVMAQKGAPSPR